MNLIIQIQGREAIPVRAIPLLTNWRFFTPDVVAQVLAGDKALDGFVVGTLQAFHFQDGAVTVFPKIWWKSWVARELRARSETIKSNQPSHEPGYQQWRDESLPMLPAGAFVWKDEFERLHAQNWDRRIRLFGCVSSGDSEDEQNSPISRNLAAFVEEGLTSLEEWRELDFSPYVRPALWSVVMEGVPPQQVTPSLATTATASAEMSDPAKVERKAKLDEAFRKIKTASIADVESDAEVEELLSQREDAKAMLARREEVLRNASALGNIKNLKDAEVAFFVSQKAVDTIEERIRVMRGDYTESHQASLAATPSPEPVGAGSPMRETDRAGSLSLMTVIRKPQSCVDVAWPYLVATYIAGQYATAKVFYQTLEREAGSGGSPFDKGTGQNLGSLFVRANGKTLALKTIANKWNEIRSASQSIARP